MEQRSLQKPIMLPVMMEFTSVHWLLTAQILPHSPRMSEYCDIYTNMGYPLVHKTIGVIHQMEYHTQSNEESDLPNEIMNGSI